MDPAVVLGGSDVEDIPCGQTEVGGDSDSMWGAYTQSSEIDSLPSSSRDGPPPTPLMAIQGLTSLPALPMTEKVYCRLCQLEVDPIKKSTRIVGKKTQPQFQCGMCCGKLVVGNPRHREHCRHFNCGVPGGPFPREIRALHDLRYTVQKYV